MSGAIYTTNITPDTETGIGNYSLEDFDRAIRKGVAKDGQPYRNTYTWYFQMRDGVVFKAVAFFDVREFDDFWNRVSPS